MAPSAFSVRACALDLNRNRVGSRLLGQLNVRFIPVWDVDSPSMTDSVGTENA